MPRASATHTLPCHESHGEGLLLALIGLILLTFRFQLRGLPWTLLMECLCTERLLCIKRQLAQCAHLYSQDKRAAVPATGHNCQRSLKLVAKTSDGYSVFCPAPPAAPHAGADLGPRRAETCKLVPTCQCYRFPAPHPSIGPACTAQPASAAVKSTRLTGHASPSVIWYKALIRLGLFASYIPPRGTPLA